MILYVLKCLKCSFRMTSQCVAPVHLASVGYVSNVSRCPLSVSTVLRVRSVSAWINIQQRAFQKNDNEFALRVR